MRESTSCPPAQVRPCDRVPPCVSRSNCPAAVCCRAAEIASGSPQSLVFGGPFWKVNLASARWHFFARRRGANGGAQGSNTPTGEGGSHPRRVSSLPTRGARERARRPPASRRILPRPAGSGAGALEVHGSEPLVQPGEQCRDLRRLELAQLAEEQRG